MVRSSVERRTARNDAQTWDIQRNAAYALASIGENLVRWNKSLVDIDQIADEAEIAKVERERRLRDARNLAFLDEEHRDKRNAIASMALDAEYRAAALNGRLADIDGEVRLVTQQTALLRRCAERDRVWRERYPEPVAPPPPPSPQPEPRTAATDARIVDLDAEERLIAKEIAVTRKRAELESVTRELHPLPDPPPDPEIALRQRIQAAARLIVRDASESIVKTDRQHLHHAYAGCHYLAARLRGLTHETACAELLDLLVDRMTFQPLAYDDAMYFQKLWHTLMTQLQERTTQERTAAEERALREAEVAMKRLDKEAAVANWRTMQAKNDTFGRSTDYDPTE